MNISELADKIREIATSFDVDYIFQEIIKQLEQDEQ